MNYLRELVYVVNRNKVKRIELLDLEGSPSSKVNELYLAISDGRVKSDEDAKALLYKGDETPNAYYNLKARLKERLLNTLFFVDVNQPKQTDRRLAMHETSKSLAAAQLLIAKGARKVAIKEFTRLLKVAEKYEFTHIALTAARVLRHHHGTMAIDHKKYEHYRNLCSHYQEVDNWEDLADCYYGDIVSAYYNKKTDQEKLGERCADYYAELRPMEGKIDSYKFAFHTALLRLMQYTLVNDYISTISVSEELIKSFSGRPFATNTAIQNFLHHQVVGYLQLRDFQKGLEAVRKSQGLSIEGTSNWFQHQEYHFMLAMQTGQYQEAYKVYLETTNHDQYSYLKESEKENWILIHAYLAFLRSHDLITIEQKDGRFPNFRLQSFLNKLPNYVRDKEGKNISVLIIQIVYLISNNKRGEAIDRIEGMKKYCLRYLSKEENRRSYYFLQLLITIPSGGFDPDRIKFLSKKPLEQLTALPSTRSNIFERMEVVPYEILWEMILSYI